MAKVFGEECNSKDWILHYEVSKIDRFMFVAIYQRNISVRYSSPYQQNMDLPKIFFFFFYQKSSRWKNTWSTIVKQDQDLGYFAGNEISSSEPLEWIR